MDAIFDHESTNAELFNSSSLIYIHCCDFSHTFTFTVPSLAFLKLSAGFRVALEIRWIEVSCSCQCAVKCNIRGVYVGIYLLLLLCSLFCF